MVRVGILYLASAFFSARTVDFYLLRSMYGMMKFYAVRRSLFAFKSSG